MAKFTVKYRNKSGQIDFTEVDAANRAAVFPVLKERGITPIMISEGAMPKRKGVGVGGGGGSHSSFGFIVIIFILIAVLGGLAWWFFFSPAPNTRHQAPSTNHPAPTPVPEVEPAKPAPPKPAKVEPEKPAELPPQRVGEIRNGYRLLPSGRLHRVRGVITTGVERVTLIDRTFNRDTDRMIAHLLVADPGGTVVGDSESVFRSFDENFVASLEETIAASPDDDDYVKDLKRAVNEARAELKARADKGESPAQMMIETREQLRELMLYREDLEAQVVKLADDGDMSQEDYDNLIEAANKMLEERGSKPVELPKLVESAIELSVLRNKANKKESENEEPNE